MDAQAYMQMVKSRFQPHLAVRRDTPDMYIVYEEIMRAEWLATKLTITSVVTCVPSIEPEKFAAYTNQCLKDAIRHKKGLPRGFQNGVASFCTVASHRVSPSAIAFALSRAAKHFAAFSVAAIFDLSTDRL